METYVTHIGGVLLLQAVFSWMFLLGAVVIVLGFVGVAILEHLGAWDPIWAKIKKLKGGGHL